MSVTNLSLLLLVLGQASFSEAGQGLRGPAPLDAKSVEASLLAELSNTLRPSNSNESIASIQEALMPMYKSVPKEADGLLSHAVVRYMLHRYFAQRNSWFIRGLEPGSGSQKASENQTLQDLQEWVPSYLQSFIENLQGGRGISLKELAVMAATLEDLVHKESNERLDKAFAALQIPHSDSLAEPRLRKVLEVYMMIYMLGGNFSIKGEAGVMKAHRVFTEKLKDWQTVQEWIHGIQLEISPASDHEELNFTAASRVVEEAGRRYGEYNKGECNSLKSELLQIESTKAGRVRLNEFYKKGLTGVFEFNEKQDYLRTLGALDETDPSEPHVIVPNYVASRPNCLTSSNFYAICCNNECEDLMAALERKIEAPTATPETILELVSGLSSATVTAPRTLSDAMTKRLHGIARSNNGVVPLHGRLFAQWMHHGFPRECPYPHQTGTTSPQTPDEWMEAAGKEDAKHTKEEIQARVDSDMCISAIGRVGACVAGPEAREKHHLIENDLPWDEKEELLAVQTPRWVEPEVLPSAPARSSFRTLAPVGAVASFVAGMAVCAWKLRPQPKAFDSGLLA